MWQSRVRTSSIGLGLMLGLWFLTGCGGDPGEGEECDPDVSSPCADGFVCAETESGGHACYAPVVIEGEVRDATDDSPIEDAQVVGLDNRRVAVTDVAVTDADGNYTLEIPVTRTDDGEPADQTFTLRADAADYQVFPGGVRQALPVHTSDTEQRDEDWVIDRPPTAITLLPLPDGATGNAHIAGEVLAGDEAAGTLVVAEGGGEAYSGVAGRNGNYTIFDVPPGDYTIRGYKAGLQLEEASVTVDDEPATGVDLEAADEDPATVSGQVNIVDAPGGSATSVVLAVESTFDEQFGRGDIPPGLRAPRTGEPDVTGEWTIDGVPDGDYVVLAAFENDELVRDPDQTIGGTETVTVSIPDDGSRDIELAESFKVTEALEIIEPGADGPTEVGSAPTLTWADDSSEDYYTVRVYNAHGDEVWQDENVDRVTGADQVEVEYGGPLESGMYYQFRATSWREKQMGGGSGETAISTTEDLKGVFFAE